MVCDDRRRIKSSHIPIDEEAHHLSRVQGRLRPHDVGDVGDGGDIGGRGGGRGSMFSFLVGSAFTSTHFLLADHDWIENTRLTFPFLRHSDEVYNSLPEIHNPTSVVWLLAQTHNARTDSQNRFLPLKISLHGFFRFVPDGAASLIPFCIDKPR